MSFGTLTDFRVRSFGFGFSFFGFMDTARGNKHFFEVYIADQNNTYNQKPYITSRFVNTELVVFFFFGGLAQNTLSTGSLS